MFVRIHSPKKYGNTGSSNSIVEYLEKEKRLDRTVIPSSSRMTLWAEESPRYTDLMLDSRFFENAA